MVIEYHEHVKDDINNIKDDVLKAHIKQMLDTSFYNVSIESSKYPQLHLYKTKNGVEILFLKKINSVLIVSIKKH